MKTASSTRPILRALTRAVDNEGRSPFLVHRGAGTAWTEARIEQGNGGRVGDRVGGATDTRLILDAARIRYRFSIPFVVGLLLIGAAFAITLLVVMSGPIVVTGNPATDSSKRTSDGVVSRG
jgi:hypothetical protein